MVNQYNRAASHTRVWRWLLVHGAASRTEIASAVKLSKVAISTITAELIADGWLTETGTVGGYAGRPAGLVDLHPQAGSVLGLDLQRQVVRCVLTDLRGAQAVQTETPLTTPQHSTQAVLNLIRAAQDAAPHGPLRQVVLAVPAPVGAGGQPEAPSGLPEFGHEEITRWCRGRDLPLAFENDVKLAAVAEHRSGVALGYDNFALLAERGTGVALGLFLGARLYRGDQGRAGELSALRWPDAGHLTPLETLPPGVRETALAQIVSGLAAALDLRLLVVQPFSPPGSAATDLLSSGLVQQLQALAPGNVSVVVSRHGHNGPLWGAAQEAAQMAQASLVRAGLPPWTGRTPDPLPAQALITH
jgi:ROK family